MKKYKYKVEVLDEVEHDCEYCLNLWAEQGWRLVAVVPMGRETRYILESDHAE